MTKILLINMVMIFSMAAGAAVETYQFDSPEQEVRFRQLGLELRCPKCQNQAIGDSDAEISGDLRAVVYRMIKEARVMGKLRNSWSSGMVVLFFTIHRSISKRLCYG